jgi:putative ABC transport system substrate-binding protein
MVLDECSGGGTVFAGYVDMATYSRFSNCMQTFAACNARSIGGIVFVLVSDPVGSGFVASFPRPGGNATGFNVSEQTMAEKWLELLKYVAPHVARVAMLFNPVSAAAFADYWLTPFKAAAPSFGVEAIAAPVRDRSELEPVIAAQAREPNAGLIAMPDSFTDTHRAEITSLAARYRLPAVYPFRLLRCSRCRANRGQRLG